MFKKGQIFNFASIKDRKRNNFDLSYSSALTGKMGDLIPIMCKEVVAGDKFRFNTDMLIRFNPLVAPIYQSIDAYTHFFYVPFRLLWDNWEDFITGGKDNNFQYGKPTIQLNKTNAGKGSLADYLNFPSLPFADGYETPIIVDAAPFKAYQLIYNEYYRDQNLIDEVLINTNLNGPLSSNLTEPLVQLRKRSWEHDYFTSCLPWAQKGASVQMPNSTSKISSDGQFKLTPLVNGTVRTVNGKVVIDTGSNQDAQYISGLKVDSVQSPTINDFRRALAVQKYQELLARAGSRYTEWLRAFFGTSPSDARLQRPEYVGGGMQPVYVQEVLQQSATLTDTTPLGTFAGKATSAGSTRIVTKEFKEPGLLMGILSVRPHTAYFQGTPREFFKWDRFDHFTPQFEHIGEQPVYTCELYGGNTTNPGVFGYLPRYAEYKYSNDEIHGEFRDTLKYWTLARTFGTTPSLSKEFIECNPSNEIFAMPDEPNLLIQIHHNILAKRKMSVYSSPSI